MQQQGAGGREPLEGAGNEILGKVLSALDSVSTCAAALPKTRLTLLSLSTHQGRVCAPPRRQALPGRRPPGVSRRSLDRRRCLDTPRTGACGRRVRAWCRHGVCVLSAHSVQTPSGRWACAQRLRGVSAQRPDAVWMRDSCRRCVRSAVWTARGRLSSTHRRTLCVQTARATRLFGM